MKNGFVLLPMFFGGKLLDGVCVAQSLLAMVAFCFASSAIYCLNDIVDAPADRLHPAKRTRPVASGEVKPMTAAATALLCIGIAMAICSVIPTSYRDANCPRELLLCTIGTYLVLNAAYCLWLKRIALIDVTIIAIGFVLRLYAGAFASGIYLSKWIISMTFLLALFLALAKRRDDVLKYEATGEKMRANIAGYNLTFLNQALTLLSAVILVAYFMYTTSDEGVAGFSNEYLYFTSVFVLLGLLRYLQISIVKEKSGSPTKVLLRDRFIQVCILLWIISYALIIY